VFKAVEPRGPPRRCRADPVYRPFWPVLCVYYRMTRSHVIDLLFWKTRSREFFTFTSDFVEWRWTVLWVLERRQARRSRSVCCEGSFGDSRWEWEWVIEWYDWRSLGASPLSRSIVFFATPWHCRELSNEHWLHPVQVLIATTVDARHHRPFAVRPTTPAVRVVAVVHYTVFYDASAALRLLLATSDVFWVTFSVLYYVIDSFSLFTC